MNKKETHVFVEGFKEGWKAAMDYQDFDFEQELHDNKCECQHRNDDRSLSPCICGVNP